MLSIFVRKKRAGANSIETVFEAIDGRLLQHRSVCLPYEGVSIRAILGNIHFARCNRGKVNHITGDAHYIALSTGRNTLLTIHDTQSALKGNWLKCLIIKLLWFIIPVMIVKKVSVISETTRSDLLRIVPFARNKITIIHNPYKSELLGEAKEMINGKPCILHFGTKENKNLKRVLAALQGIDCSLIVVGKMTEEQVHLAEGLDYVNYYDLPFAEIVNLYRKCDIVSFPSTFEGFGMPVIEANVAQRPILAGDIPVLRDIAHDSALFVNPNDIRQIRQGFIRLICEPQLRSELVAKGVENAKRFSPSVIAGQYNQLYDRLMR